MRSSGRTVNHRDLRDVVRGAADAGAERAEADRRRLGDDRVRDWAEREREDEGDDDAEARLRKVRAVVARRGDGGDDAEREEEGHVRGGAPEVDRAPAEVPAEHPGERDGDDLQA
jgi:hypothetical protein